LTWEILFEHGVELGSDDDEAAASSADDGPSAASPADDEPDEAAAPESRQTKAMRLGREGLSQREIAQECGYRSHTSVGRLERDEGTANGHVGRPTHLSFGAELHCLVMLHDLTLHGSMVTTAVASEIFTAAYLAECPDSRPPTFDARYLRRMAHRHGVRVRHKPVTGSEERRIRASTRSNVEIALQSLRAIIRCKFGGRIHPSCFWVLDETSVTPDATAGRPALTINATRAHHGVQAAPFVMQGTPVVNLCGHVALRVLVTNHAPSLNPDAVLRLHGDPSNMLVFNSSGHSEADRDGDGTWFAMMERVAKELPKHMKGYTVPVEGDERPRGILVVDGLKVHENRRCAGVLAKAGIELVRLSPNLTHVIQILDNSHVFGKLKECMRTEDAGLANRLGPMPFENLVEERFKLLGGISCFSIVTAAQESGISFDAEGYTYMDQSTISATLDRLQAQGRIGELSDRHGGLELRNRNLLIAEHITHELTREGVLAPEANAFVSPEVYRATLRAAAGVPHRFSTRSSRYADHLSKGEHRVPIPESMRQSGTWRSGTVVVNPNALTDGDEYRREHKADLVRKRLRSKTSKPVDPPNAMDPANVEEDVPEAEKQMSLEEKKKVLRERLPNIDLEVEPAAAPVKKALHNKRSIAWAVRRVLVALHGHARGRAGPPPVSAEPPPPRHPAQPVAESAPESAPSAARAQERAPQPPPLPASVPARSAPVRRQGADPVAAPRRASDRMSKPPAWLADFDP
jgi:hypothetical protein